MEIRKDRETVMAGKRCGWCRKRIWWFQFEAGFLSSAVRTGKPFHLDCKAESEKYPAIADRQAERTRLRLLEIDAAALANAEAEARIAADGLSNALEVVRDKHAIIAGRDDSSLTGFHR
jgi:hypothetical protein